MLPSKHPRTPAAPPPPALQASPHLPLNGIGIGAQGKTRNNGEPLGAVGLPLSHAACDMLQVLPQLTSCLVTLLAKLLYHHSAGFVVALSL